MHDLLYTYLCTHSVSGFYVDLWYYISVIIIIIISSLCLYIKIITEGDTELQNGRSIIFKDLGILRITFSLGVTWPEMDNSAQKSAKRMTKIGAINWQYLHNKFLSVDLPGV